MPIELREDVAYIILKKIRDSSGEGKHHVDFQATDFTGRDLAPSDFLGHMDYLNQKEYIDAEFTGNAYATQEDVPDLIDAEEVDLRVANTLGAPDGPLPHLVRFKRAQLTDKGRQMLQRMEQNPPEVLEEGPVVPIATEDMSFLEKVMLKGELTDIFDARDLTVVVYRTMRDLMTTEAAQRVAEELDKEALPTKDKSLQRDIAKLWQDTNPLVAWLSKVRAPLKIDDDTFIFRIEQEGGLPRGTTGKRVIKAVFSATKEELSPDRVSEISSFLPGKIKQIWEEA